jgi:hypothetical protein
VYNSWNSLITSTVQTAEQSLGGRAAAYNYMGEMPTKISRWVQKQATIWWSVLKDPKEFVAGTDINSPKGSWRLDPVLIFCSRLHAGACRANRSYQLPH